MKSEENSFDHDVVIVGGGPAGCSAGVFTAREGLNTLIYDRGRSSLRRCAYLENYLGFPDGIDIETFYERMHDHAEVAGCELRPDLVESVKQRDGEGFRVKPQEGDPVTSRRVIAATKYDAEYIRALDEDAMFVTKTHDGEEYEQFDREYPGPEGSTPIDGLYVASPSHAAVQAITAAGHGAHVARRLVKDFRTDDGWWGSLVDSPDWIRRATERDEDEDRSDWLAEFDDHYAGSAPVDTDSDRYQHVRAEVIDDRVESYITEVEAEHREERGSERLLDYIDDDLIIARARELQEAGAVDKGDD